MRYCIEFTPLLGQEFLHIVPTHLIMEFKLSFKILSAIFDLVMQSLVFLFVLIGKWHGIVVSMMTCGPEDTGSSPRLAKDHNGVIFFLGVFMIQFNLI